MPPPGICLHCERAAALREGPYRQLRLCDVCSAHAGLRRVYRKARGATPADEERIQALVDRASAGLPLFDGPVQLGLPLTSKAESRRKRKRLGKSAKPKRRALSSGPRPNAVAAHFGSLVLGTERNGSE